MWGRDSLVRPNFFYFLHSPRDRLVCSVLQLPALGRPLPHGLGRCKRSSSSRIFLCRHFRSFTPRSGIASQIPSPFRQYDNLQYRFAPLSNKHFSLALMIAVSVPWLKFVFFKSMEQMRFKTFACSLQRIYFRGSFSSKSLRVAAVPSHRTSCFIVPLCPPLSLCWPSDRARCLDPAECRQGSASVPRTRPLLVTGCGAWSQRKMSGKKRVRSHIPQVRRRSIQS